jgi:hypothetical protein
MHVLDIFIQVHIAAAIALSNRFALRLRSTHLLSPVSLLPAQVVDYRSLAKSTGVLCKPTTRKECAKADMTVCRSVP